MPLAAGTRLGSFEIVTLLGAGGMGEVYRARDLNLKRDVAIKVLRDAFAREPQRVSRFEREATLLASLNHSRIAIVHDFQQSGERHFLVMELVEGDTLADRLARGALPIDDALRIARQMAEALEAAHQRGVIHRDLKPANIKIGSDGHVKILDFGLAKIFEKAAPSLDAATSTAVLGETADGVILGTAAYMSPEQARGEPVDERTDIWALGCVIWEMLTGRPVFAGGSLSDTIAAVLRAEPDWQALPDQTPPRIRLLLRRCLRKDARRRLHAAADVRIELEDAADDVDGSVLRSPPSRHRRLASIVLALLGGAAIASALWWVRDRTSQETPTPTHLSLTSVSRNSSALYLNANHQLAISPDGRNIVYVANRDGKRQLLLRSLAEPDARPVDGADGAKTAFFSRDGQWIAFGNEQELQKVAVSGGSPVTICKLSSTAFYGGDWGADNTIVFVPDYSGGLWSVSSGGGTPQPLLRTDPEHDRVSYADPDVLPNGGGVLFTLASGHAVTADDLDVAVLSPGAKEPRILIRGGSNARYLPTGHIVYVHGGALLSVDFDLSTLTAAGTPVPVMGGLGRTWSGDADYAISDTGTLVYEPETGAKNGRVLAMVDRQGHVQPITAPGNYGEFSVSPNGRSVAARIFAINDDIWVYSITTGTPLRLTFEPRDEIFPKWTPDSARIAYGTRSGQIFWRSSDGSGQREEISRGEYPRYPESFSPDGKSLAFVEIHPSRQRDIWLMSLEGDRTARPLVATEADEWGARFSPNGRWLAYVSNETGKDEIFIREIGSTGGRKRVSSDGGTQPEWAPDGQELFFTKGDQLAVVSVDGHGEPVGRDRILLTVPKFQNLQYDPGTPEYGVMPDGQHFVFGFSPQPSDTHYNVVLNWFEVVKQRQAIR
jgi:eukaryotic-like serine/threonine-protein kinase